MSVIAAAGFARAPRHGSDRVAQIGRRRRACGCARSCRPPGRARKVLLIFGHRRSVRAFAAISHRFLCESRIWPNQPDSSLVFAGFRRHFEIFSWKGISSEASRRIRDALRFPAADADDHGAGHAFHPRIRCHRAGFPHHRPRGAESRPIATSSAIGAAASSRRPAAAPGRRRHRSRQRTAGSGVRAGAFSTRSRICPPRRWSICSAAAIARPIGCRISPGNCSSRRRPAGRGSRRSAISSISHIAFGYEHARATKTAWEAYRRRQGRVPRLRPSGHRVLPLHEHSGALLHGLSQRHRHAAAWAAGGFRRLVRGLSSAAAGTRSIRATTCRASAAC